MPSKATQLPEAQLLSRLQDMPSAASGGDEPVDDPVAVPLDDPSSEPPDELDVDAASGTGVGAASAGTLPASVERATAHAGRAYPPAAAADLAASRRSD